MRIRTILPLAKLGCLSSGTLIIERALMHVGGVSYVYVNPATEMAYVAYDDSCCQEAVLIEAVRQAGFDVEPACPNRIAPCSIPASVQRHPAHS